jgi:hypothetical protein
MGSQGWEGSVPGQVPLVSREGRACGLHRSPSSISFSALAQPLCKPLQLKWVAQANAKVELLIGFLAGPPPPQLRGMLALHATSPLPLLREKEGVIVLGWGH